MHGPNQDPKFEQYRRERERRRLLDAGPQRDLGAAADALRQIEAAEAEEVRDRQLSREVHDFFEAATRTAAGIVSKVADTQQERAAARLKDEMQEFLESSLRRMRTFVLSLGPRQDGPEAEAVVEAQMRNLVGPVLDGFRAEGTAALADKHLGADPLATAPGAVRAELRPRRTASPAAAPHDAEPFAAVRAAASAAGCQVEPNAAIEEHLVAEVCGGGAEPAAPAEPVETASDAAAAAAEQKADDLRFQNALRGLVQQGLMTPDEARAAWRARQEQRQGAAR